MDFRIACASHYLRLPVYAGSRVRAPYRVVDEDQTFHGEYPDLQALMSPFKSIRANRMKRPRSDLGGFSIHASRQTGGARFRNRCRGKRGIRAARRRLMPELASSCPRARAVGCFGLWRADLAVLCLPETHTAARTSESIRRRAELRNEANKSCVFTKVSDCRGAWQACACIVCGG
jgi:hypothetical protein